MDQIKGKVAVITGAAGGIGLATAALLAREGAKVVLADINADALGAAVKDLQGQGFDVKGVPTNVGDFDSVKALADAAYAAYGAVHLVHLNAGIAAMNSLFDDETASWRRIIDINLMSVIWGIKAFVQRMIDGGEEGVIVATSSGAGGEGTAYNTAAYATTKMAVVSLMECLHGQLRDRGSKVRAGVIFPPLTATKLSGDAPGVMKHVENLLQSRGVPAVLVSPEGVAKLFVDGVKRGRFFMRVSETENASCFDGAMGADYFAWNEKAIRGRAEAQLSDGQPDPYLW